MLVNNGRADEVIAADAGNRVLRVLLSLCRWLSGHNPISLLLLLLHQLADSISSSSSFARELWWCSFGALWNSVELDVTRTGNGRARVCVCVRSQPGTLCAISLHFFFFNLAAGGREQSTRAPAVPAGYLCPFQFGAPPRRTATATGNGTAFTLSFAHLPVRWSITENGTAHLVFDARKRERLYINFGGAAAVASIPIARSFSILQRPMVLLSFSLQGAT